MGALGPAEVVRVLCCGEAPLDLDTLCGLLEAEKNNFGESSCWCAGSKLWPSLQSEHPPKSF